eukprot:1144073-Pelagomonas_calceolata.AAC.4
MESTLYLLSGCQCPVIKNMVTEQHNIASIMIFESGSADCLAQYDLHITEQVSNRAILLYLFDPIIPDQARRYSSRPDTILVTPCPTNPNKPLYSPSHRVLRSMRGKEKNNFSLATSCIEYPKPLYSLHRIRYCEDKMPNAQLETSQQQQQQ